MKHRYLLAVLCGFIAISHVRAQGPVTVKGKVTDENKQPLSFVTISVNQGARLMYTDKSGQFSFTLNNAETKIKITASMVGKVAIDSLIDLKSVDKEINFILKDLNLSLKEVQVSAVRKSTSLSNSSILFDRQAIEQVQAFSLADILNNLPGKKYAALDLQSPKNITLRSDAGGSAAQNNAQGAAIIIDGLAQSNNANMQSKNLGTFGGTSIINDYKNQNSYDVTFGGIDLREIPADNIESIEVISGVAPAQYGDLTSGAIIINRQAGKTDYQFNTRINGGSSNFSLSKGFDLGKKTGFLNFNLNYLNSNNDPRDDMKKYDRVSGGIMYTTFLSNRFKNTFSLDYSAKIDDAKQDPDDGRELLTYSKNRRLGFSNRMAYEFNKPYLQRLTFNVGADLGYQDTYSQWYLNGNPKPMANKDTTGIYEGFYIPGTFLAKDQVVGKPKNVNANLNLVTPLHGENFSQQLSYGGSFSLSSNKGQGVLFDPEHPRFSNLGNKNERPYNFELIPSLINVGFFVEDKLNFNLLNRNLNLTAGLRYDIQNGYGSIQPRINMAYPLLKNLKLNLAYGRATKAPTMAYRYPGPTYFDIPLINYYTGDVRNSLLLVYTYKYMPDNRNLKSSRSEQTELGLNYENPFFSTSLFAYYKNDDRGFNTQTTFFPLRVPVYGYTEVVGKKPVYFPTGDYTYKAGLTASVVGNITESKTKGIEWFLSTRKIPALQTSFSLNSTLVYSDYYNALSTVYMANESDIIAGKKAWYGIYKAMNYKNRSLTAKVNSDTHIPRLGFVVSLYYDYTFMTDRKTLNNNLYPFAYLDKELTYYPIDHFDPSNPDYGHLTKLTNTRTQAKLPFGYGTLSMRLAKEINRRLRFSVNAYNVLNIREEYYDELTKTLYSYNNPINIGAEISIKF